ncbi:unnamed protein product [Chondrus crispus]|uniref:Uncharacterized protein n=1 Tax=Chondrus crispus TaxID=2769 RepID=R7QDU2_CHOCR|nr:unnamed protein product [Chondrus crispus]CDF35611.1 unnamed protein product [Chondrus crispus]|eukprot:XP_005715430.1 unnamed protein product [Chondrus crispus]
MGRCGRLFAPVEASSFFTSNPPCDLLPTLPALVQLSSGNWIYYLLIKPRFGGGGDSEMNPTAPATRYIYSYSGSPQLGYKYVVEIHLAQRSKLLHASGKILLV